VKVATYLKDHQPALYQTMVNAITTDHLSHAYLISGEAGTPLLPVAMYLAKSIVCDDPQPLACEKCLSCLRVDDGNYADFMLFDGSKKTIKKEDVQAVESNFEKTALETKGKMIYVLHLVENMTAEAVNSLLKFLEEPGRNIYAFLTTENEAKVLPTILSRSQTIRLKLNARTKVIAEAIDLGVAQDDAEMLSYFYNDGTSILERSSDEDYIQAKEALNDLLHALCKDKNEAIFVSQQTIIPLLKSKESARFYLDMLAQAFRDLINIPYGGHITLKSYGTLLNELVGKCPHPEKSLVEIMTSRSQLDLNLNIPLLLDHVIYSIIKGD
jgi:DNA polymerase III subunit delta'